MLEELKSKRGMFGNEDFGAGAVHNVAATVGGRLG